MVVCVINFSSAKDAKKCEGDFFFVLVAFFADNKV